ncbi:MAG: DUF2089 domain-containing protein [Bdellovibrionales bacterium]|nr:DUF2089 domain-containing protein [Bdellovibrionales bacterium]
MKTDWQDLLQLVKGEDFSVERVRLERTGIAVEGNFELPPLARLSQEDQVFVAAFVSSHGSIKEMERLFGVSYPTIKNRLNQIGTQLGGLGVAPVTRTDEVLERVERGELTADEAVELLKR